MSGDASPPARPRRRWFQWRLRTMLILLTVCAGLASAWMTYLEPFRRERLAIERLIELKADVQTEPAGPRWLRSLVGEQTLSHGVVIDVGAAADRDALHEQLFLLLPELPTLRKLYLRGVPLTDGDLSVLSSVRTLESLYLGETPVSIAAIEDLVDAMPDLDVDIAPAEHLYFQAWGAYRDGELDAATAVVSFELAARWKLACAPFKHNPRTEVAALEQLVGWLDKLVDSEEANPSIPNTPQAAAWAAVARCALTQARMRLARATADRAAEVDTCRDGARQADELHRAGWAAYRAQRTHPELLAAALERVADLQVAAAEVSGDKSAAKRVLRANVDDLKQLLDLAAATKEKDPDWWIPFAVTKPWYTEAQVRAARAAGNQAEATRVLAAAASGMPEVRLGLGMADRFGDIMPEMLLVCCDKSFAIEIASAEATGNAELARHLRESRRWFIAVQLMSYSRGFSEKYFVRCRYAIECIKEEGRAFYDGRAGSLAPDDAEEERIYNASVDRFWWFPERPKQPKPDSYPLRRKPKG